MKSRMIPFAMAVVLMFVAACSTVPITGRERLDLVPESSVLQASFQQYEQFMDEHQLSDNRQAAQMVKTVGEDIAKAVEQYFRENDMAGVLEGYSWEFNLVESDQANAFAMPGGKVVVYEGILPIARDANGLAVILGHEIAHAVAGHASERMSQQLATQLGGMALSTAISKEPAATQQLWMSAFGAGTQVGVLLPFSRLHESEADHLGLVFMSMAGYDPQAAIGFWRRMAGKKDGAAPPEFLSTHPADETRIAAIRELMPEVLPIYARNQNEGIKGEIEGISG